MRETDNEARSRALILALIMAVMIIGGPPRAVAEEAGGKLLLLLDSSGSMKEKAADGKTKMAAAKAAMTKIIGRLPTKAEVGLRVYGATVFDRKDKGACTDTQLVVPIGTGNADRLKSAIARFKPYGETPIAYSLEQAAKDLGGTGRRTILLVSDGEETCVPDPCPVAAKIAAAGVDLKIDVIGFRVSGKARKQLQCIAEKGNGDYQDAEDTEDLERDLSRLSTRAFRPFRFSGNPITGADRPGAAPELGTGTWLDRMPRTDRVKYYRLRRTMPHSTFWIGANLMAPANRLTQLSLQLYSSDDLDSPCAKATPNKLTWFGGPELLTGFVVSEAGTHDCTGSDELLLELGTTTFSKGDVSGAPVELRVGEEPPVPDRSGLPAVAGDSTWQKMSPGRSTPVIGGTSFADASLIKPGTFTSDIAPGERQTFRVPAGWGQRVQVLARTGKYTDADRELVGRSRYLRVDLLSPYGGSATGPDFDINGQPGHDSGVVGPEGAQVVASTKAIGWMNRESSFDWDRATAIAGDFYLTVRLDRKDGDPPFALPLTLTVAVIGKAQDPPPYRTEVASPTPSVPAQTPTPTPTATIPTSAPSGTAPTNATTSPWRQLAGIAAVVIVLGALLLVFLRLRRRG